MSPMSFWKRLSTPRPLSVEALSIPASSKKSQKSFVRICEVISQTVAGREYFYQKGNGLSLLLQAGLTRALKEAIDLSAQKGIAYLLLHFNDLTDDLTCPVGDFDRWALGDVCTTLPFPNLHPSRYLEIPYWKSSAEREALWSTCALFDRAATLLGDGLQASLKPILHLGDLDSLGETKSYTSSEIEELKALLSRLSTSQAQILGRNDTLSTLSPAVSIADLFSHLAGYVSFLAGVPVTFFLSSDKEDKAGTDLFYKEIENISHLVVRPLIDELLRRFGLNVDWKFRELKSFSEKESAEADYKRAGAAAIWIETLQAVESLVGHDEIKEGAARAVLAFFQNR